jgi:hypothetical protein
VARTREAKNECRTLVDKPLRKQTQKQSTKIQVVVLWVVTPCSDVVGCHPEDVRSNILRNA